MSEKKESMGAVEAALEGMKAAMSGFTQGLGAAYDAAKPLKPFIEHGAHEVAAAMFNGSAFVMYANDDNKPKDDPQHGLGNQGMEDEGRGR